MTRDELIRRVNARVQTLNDIFNGKYHYCDNCRTCVEHARVLEDGTEICPDCEEEVRPASFMDYLYGDDCLGVEYRVWGRSSECIRSVCIATDLGGPDIRVDTGTNAVVGIWGSDRVEVYFNPKIGDRIEEEFDEIWRDS